MAGTYKTRRTAGHAVVELSLMIPWIFFLFVGALDFGFYSYALIATQNAARVAALYTAQCAGTATDQATACRQVRQELAWMPNSSSFSSGCESAPLAVTVSALTDAEGQPASQVRVSYQTVQLIPIPGLVPGQTTITRTAQLRVFGD
jgi:Flp pilus assembly protein TadG